MNIMYNVDSSTGMMNLKFNTNLLDSLPPIKKMFFIEYILPMLTMNPKLILTGSLSLKMLGMEPMDDIGDFDLALNDFFTEDDYNTLKNFFDLTKEEKNHYVIDFLGSKPNYTFNPKEKLWSFYKHVETLEPLEPLLQSISPGAQPSSLISHSTRTYKFKLDIFNDEIIREKDIITIKWDDFEVRLIHPSITWSHRIRYALDSRIGNNSKYYRNMDDLNKNIQSFYNKQRVLNDLVMRVYEHNTNTQDDINKRVRVRNIVSNREMNVDNFIKEIFQEPEINIKIESYE